MQKMFRGLSSYVHLTHGLVVFGFTLPNCEMAKLWLISVPLRWFYSILSDKMENSSVFRWLDGLLGVVGRRELWSLNLCGWALGWTWKNVWISKLKIKISSLPVVVYRKKTILVLFFPVFFPNESHMLHKVETHSNSYEEKNGKKTMTSFSAWVLLLILFPDNPALLPITVICHSLKRKQV